MASTTTRNHPHSTAPTSGGDAVHRGWPAWMALVAFAAISQAAGIIGIPFTDREPGGWYDQLERPFFEPPSEVFGPVWTFMYITMGVAAWLVWRRRQDPGRRPALTLFAVQLVLNAAWTPIFFGAEAPGWALAEIVLLLVAVVAMAAAFWTVDRRAAWLLVPYALWVTYATAINIGVVVLN